MKILDPYLLPYLFSQAVSLGFVLVARKNTPLARLLFSLLFTGASGINFYLGFTNPAVYLDYASMALPIYRDFINGWFSHYTQLIVPLIAVGQLLIGVGMLLNGRWVWWACLGTIIFLLSIAPLMVGSAFPFSLTVAWAAWMLLNQDKKAYLWQPLNLPQQHRTSTRLLFYGSVLALLFAMIASAISSIDASLYHDNAFVKTAWQANDGVTLLVTLAAFMGLFLLKWNVKTQLIWAGILSYLIYTYAFYLFGTAFNGLFLVYVCIVALSMIAFVATLVQLPVQSMSITSNYLWFIEAYLGLIALMLVLVEVPPTLAFAFSGSLPDIITKTGHQTSIVYALDLTLIVPTCLMALVWVWQGKPWGIVLAAIVLVKGIAYGLVLCAGALLLASRSAEKDPLLPFYVFLVLGGIAGLLILLKSIYTTNQEVQSLEPIPMSHRPVSTPQVVNS